MNPMADQTPDEMVRRLVRLLVSRFGFVACVDGLEWDIDEARRLIEAAAPVCAPERLARIVANLGIWAVRARAEEECWDFRREGLASWLGARPSARVWVSGEAFDRGPIAEWLADRLGVDRE